MSFNSSIVVLLCFTFLIRSFGSSVWLYCSFSFCTCICTLCSSCFYEWTSWYFWLQIRVLCHCGSSSLCSFGWWFLIFDIIFIFLSCIVATVIFCLCCSSRRFFNWTGCVIQPGKLILHCCCMWLIWDPIMLSSRWCRSWFR